MHGANMACRSAGMHLLRSPPLRFSNHGSSFRRPSANPPARSRRIENGLSAYLFFTILNSQLARSVPNSRPRVRSFTGDDQRSKPVTNLQSRTLKLSHVSFERLAWAYGPIFPSLPEAGNRESHCLSPDHRSGFRYLRQAYYSLNLLEPSASCTQSLFRSIAKCAGIPHFLGFFHSMFSAVSRYISVRNLWIKRPFADLFAFRPPLPPPAQQISAVDLPDILGGVAFFPPTLALNSETSIHLQDRPEQEMPSKSIARYESRLFTGFRDCLTMHHLRHRAGATFKRSESRECWVAYSEPQVSIRTV